MTLPIRVGIIDDHPGVRMGIRNLLASAKDILVVGEGENGADAIELANQKQPDILLLDVELPILRGDAVMQYLHDKNIDVKVLAVSSYNDPIYVQGMLENGAAGYITKDEAPVMLLDAVHSIVEDQLKWISPIAVKRLSKIRLDDINLAGSEFIILRLIVLGKSDEEISRSLRINKAELSKRIGILLDKFSMSTRAELKDRATCILSTSPQ